MPSKPTLEAKIASVVEMIHVPVGVVKNIRNVVYVNSASTLVDRITMETKLCSNCGETMLCGANQTTESCWLFSYPSIMPINSQQDCLCEKCLSASVQEEIK